MQEKVCALHVLIARLECATSYTKTTTLSYLQYTDHTTVSRFISKANAVQYNGLSNPHSSAKVIEILKKGLPLLYKDSCESIPAFPGEN